MRNSMLGTLAVLGLMAPPGLVAQVANPLPQALGLGGNYTAVARGFGAPAWNPAGLGMPDNPRVSLAVLPVAATAGLGPVGLGDVEEYGGRVIPEQTKVAWLEEITAAGGETGMAGADVTYLALSAGRVAVSATSSLRARVNVAPDVAEILLFGNAGLTGAPGSYSLEGSNLDVAGTTTLAASLALPLSLRLGPLPDQHLAVGATLTYTIGNFALLGQEAGSTLESDPVAVNARFPTLSTVPDSADDAGFADVLDNGTGIGLDIGAAWQGGPFSAGVVIRNLVNTFEWDAESLYYREGAIVWNADTAYTSFEEASVADAPAEVIERLESLYTFSPILAAGAAMDVRPDLTVTGELRHALDDNLDVGVQSHLGVGAELRAIPVIPLRAGLALVSGGYQLSGGLGLRLATVELSAAAALRDGDYGSDVLGALGLTIGAP